MKHEWGQKQQQNNLRKYLVTVLPELLAHIVERESMHDWVRTVPVGSGCVDRTESFCGHKMQQNVCSLPRKTWLHGVLKCGKTTGWKQHIKDGKITELKQMDTGNFFVFDLITLPSSRKHTWMAWHQTSQNNYHMLHFMRAFFPCHVKPTVVGHSTTEMHVHTLLLSLLQISSITI